MLSLEEMIQRLSLHHMSAGSPTKESLDSFSNCFFDQITQDLLPQIPTYTTEVDALARELASVSDYAEREENKMEFITVLSIIRTINQVDTLLNEPLTSDSARKVSALLLSFTSLLKYHFQLPIHHNNYGLKNFGRLLVSDKHNLITPFMKFFKQSTSAFGEINKMEIFEKTLTLNCILCCFNTELLGFLRSYLADIKNVDNFNQILGLNALHQSNNDSFPGMFELMFRFRNLILLEDSALLNDARSTNLLNILFFSSFHKPFLKHMISSFTTFSDAFFATLTFEQLFAISNKLVLNPNTLDYFTLLVTDSPEYFTALDDVAKLEGLENQKLCDVATFLLIKLSQHYLLYYNIFKEPNNELLEYLVEYNNTVYISLLGLSETNNQSELNILTLVPIFELFDQNFKLDYKKERDFLTVLNFALVNLDLNLSSEDDFMNLNSLLVDVGCSKSIHAILDILQTLLCFVINDNKFNSSYFSKIPLYFKTVLGFDSIPPVYRSDFSFDNNLDLQAENYGPTFNALKDIENYAVIKEAKSMALLEHALLMMVFIKSKVYKFLRELNKESNVLRLPDVFTEEGNQIDYSINAFKQGVSTKIASFKSSKSLNYKLLNSSISLGTIANLCLLPVAENYKILKSSNNFVDNSISRLLSEYTFDFTLNLILIYQEFGMMTLFKKIRELNYENLNLIVPSSALLAKLFQTKSDFKDIEFNDSVQYNESHSVDLVANILRKSVLASNLLRQFVELFDNGQSKPFKALNKFLKANPSTLKPSKISKGTVTLDVNYYINVLY